MGELRGAMPAALPGYDFASSWLAESLTAVPYQPDCGSSGGCDSLDVNLVHQGAHLLGVGARGIPSAPKAAPRSFALSAELQRDPLRNGVPHNRLGSSHVVRERRHLLLGAQDAAQHTQELTNLGLLEIPRYVFKTARSLIKLDLTNNQLGSLPAEIQHLTALETLLVPRNGLKTLPDAAISGMRALTELDCSKNELAGSLFEHVFAKALITAHTGCGGQRHQDTAKSRSARPGAQTARRASEPTDCAASQCGCRSAATLNAGGCGS